MRLAKKVTLCVGTGLWILLLFGVFQSQGAIRSSEAPSPLYTQAFWFGVGQPQAVNITYLQEEYGKSQEMMARDIKEAAWLEFNRGKVQETLGLFIQEGGPEGNVPQEELGSGIAAAAHIKWGTMRSQEALGGSIVRVAQVVAQEARIVAGKLQEGFGAMILADAQEAYGTSQEGLGRQIVRQAQLDYTGGIMAAALEASLLGEAAEPISPALVSIARRNGGNTQIANFALGVSLLEGESGLSLSPLTANMSRLPSFGEAPATDTGWGGFAEYGFFAITGFLFAMWMAGSFALHDGAPMEEMEEEDYTEYRKAA